MKNWTMEKFKMDKFKICKQCKNIENVCFFESFVFPPFFFIFSFSFYRSVREQFKTDSIEKWKNSKQKNSKM